MTLYDFMASFLSFKYTPDNVQQRIMTAKESAKDCFVCPEDSTKGKVVSAVKSPFS